MAEESTTPDLIALVRHRLEAGDRRDVDAVMGFYAPDAILDASDAGLGTYDGAEAIRAFLQEWWSGYEKHQLVPDEIRPAGEDAVLAIYTLLGWLPGSSEPLRQHNAYLFEFKDGLIVRWTVVMDIAKARAAVERLADERG